MSQSGPHLFSKKQPSSQNVSARSDAILFHDLCILPENYHIIAFQHAQFSKIPLKAFPSQLCSVFWCWKNTSIRYFCVRSPSRFVCMSFWWERWSFWHHISGVLDLKNDWFTHFGPKRPALTTGSASGCSVTGHGGSVLHSRNMENIVNVEKSCCSVGA